MAKGYPSMLALLGLVALAGYQHRDKLAELIGARNPNDPDSRNSDPDSLNSDPDSLNSDPGSRNSDPGSRNRNAEWDRVLGDVKKAGAGVGGLLSNGLSELLERFKQNGRQDVAQSWVNRGANQDITPQELEAVIGSEMLETLALQTGLSRQELLARLSRQLPEAVDKYTPDGRLPS